jgi:hypothetical protein
MPRQSAFANPAPILRNLVAGMYLSNVFIFLPNVEV